MQPKTPLLTGKGAFLGEEIMSTAKKDKSEKKEVKEPVDAPVEQAQVIAPTQAPAVETAGPTDDKQTEAQAIAKQSERPAMAIPFAPQQAGEAMLRQIDPAKEFSGETVFMNFPRNVTLTLDYSKQLKFSRGVNKVPIEVADHEYLKHNGVVKLK